MSPSASRRARARVGLRRPRPKIVFLLLLVCFIAVGAGFSALWFSRLEGLGEPWQHVPGLAAGLALALAFTLSNIVLRWIRWHFLTRHVGVLLATRDSFLIYLVTLPAIITPFSVGELFRAVLLGKKYPHHRLDVALIWVVERSSDLLICALFIALTRGNVVLLLLFGLLWLALIVGIRTMYRRVKLVDRLQPRALMVVLLLTGLAWVLPAFALSGVLRLLQSPLPFIPVLGMFSYSTIIGSITGLPLGMGVTGSLLVRELQSQGVGLAGAVLSTAVFRMGTAWFSVALGLLAALLYRRRMSAILHAQETYDHFDEIAKSYEEQIPSHIRDRLLVRKVHVMHQRLEAKEVSHRGRGLDIGCGHGWYTCEMVRLGYDMYAIDQAEQQIHLARRYAHKQNVQVQFEVASALKLPFTDNCFDFAYAINMMHHMATIKSQRQAFVEIVRVLKPGGVFFLHEINSSNLLFRFYVGYVFPMIRAIDEGNERWIRPSRLPNVAGAWWEAEIDYFTFLPDFIPAVLLQPLARFEHVLERSRFKSWSAHYVARLVKES